MQYCAPLENFPNIAFVAQSPACCCCAYISDSSFLDRFIPTRDDIIVASSWFRTVYPIFSSTISFEQFVADEGEVERARITWRIISRASVLFLMFEKIFFQFSLETRYVRKLKMRTNRIVIHRVDPRLEYISSHLTSTIGIRSTGSNRYFVLGKYKFWKSSFRCDRTSVSIEHCTFVILSFVFITRGNC